VAGVRAERELPVVWAVAKGSVVNKAILVPAALLISAFIPWAVTPLLMIGGAFLCFEGFEKLAHRFLAHDPDEARHDAELHAALVNPEADLVAVEKDKIKGAIRTDFVLSAEIVTIALGTVATAPFATRVSVLVGIATIMTVGVYGLVAGIVKLDDLGLYLTRRAEAGSGPRAAFQRNTGAAILKAAPYLMKTLSIAGTAAMFLVGGGILTHGIPPVHHFIHGLAHGAGGVFGAVLPSLLDGVFGVLAGAVVLAVVSGVKRLLPKRQASA
jgi:predicted DNA repair protein MutK